MGRSGSDLSAALLALEPEAEQCELIKDVCGYFTEDPHVNGQAEHLARLSYEQALDTADAECQLVHPGAIRAARGAGLRLVVRSLDDAAPDSIVSDTLVQIRIWNFEAKKRLSI
jgi:aspartokinase